MKRSAWLPAFLALFWLPATAQAPPERLVVGGDSAYPPFEWAGPDGSPRGFNTELMRLLANDDDSGVELEFRLGTWPETIAALDRGEIDVVPMFLSDERARRYRFTNIFYYQTHAMFGRPEQPPVDEVDGFATLDLVVEASSYAESQLRSTRQPGPLKISVNTEEALRMVHDGGADYALLASPVARELIRLNSWEIERKSAPFWPRGYAFAVRDDRTRLAEWLQARLVATMSNGDYLALYNEWSERLEPGIDASTDYLRYTLWLLVLVLLGLMLVVAWNRTLRLKVAQRTHRLTDELKQRRRAEQQSRELARRDPITNLANVRHFCRRVAGIIRHEHPAGECEVMLIRLLHLESVIRTFGYPVAERMTLEFSNALLKTHDRPVAHLGRGTFAVFDIRGKAHTHLDDLESAVRRGDAPIHPRFVAGSAFYPDDDGDINELLQKAELALAESQSRQCRWTRYGHHLQSDPVDLGIIESARADQFEGLEFVVQPQMRLDDRHKVAGELLARWTHPEFGQISPARFVPLLEQSGLIGKLTDRALAAAMDLSRRLREAGRPDTVSVNVSTRDLLDESFSHRVKTMMTQHGLPESALKLEITETSLVADPEVVRATLENLARMDVIIALDDFGKGYSSLDYISRFPIREVKIDRSFISRMTESDRDLSIVRSTIDMAHEMGMMVVGEGAETEATLEKLAELGCDLAQGWAVGYPVDTGQYSSEIMTT